MKTELDPNQLQDGQYLVVKRGGMGRKVLAAGGALILGLSTYAVFASSLGFDTPDDLSAGQVDTGAACQSGNLTIAATQNTFAAGAWTTATVTVSGITTPACNGKTLTLVPTDGNNGLVAAQTWTISGASHAFTVNAPTSDLSGYAAAIT